MIDTPQGPMGTVKRVLDRVLGIVLAALMFALVVDVVWQVFTRFALPQPSSFTDELARFLLIWVGLLGSAYAVGQRMHLAIDLISDGLTPRRRQALGIVIESVVLLFAVGVMLVGGWELVSLTLLLGQTSAALGVPLGYVYSVLPLSGAIMAFYAIFFIVEHLRALRAPTQAAADRGPDPVPHATASSTGYE